MHRHPACRGSQLRPDISYSRMNNSFDWSLVRSFLAALDSGSLLGASRELRSTQPTVGRHVAELESQLGVVLFERTGRGLLPTPSALRGCASLSTRSMEPGGPTSPRRSAPWASTSPRCTARARRSLVS